MAMARHYRALQALGAMSAAIPEPGEVTACDRGYLRRKWTAEDCCFPDEPHVRLRVYPFYDEPVE